MVSIHSNVLSEQPDLQINWGWELVDFLSSTLTKICVPAFFILSGYLFFLDQKSFTSRHYLEKLKRRVHTLLVPYILWNIIALSLDILKIKFLGFPDHGLIIDGNISWTKLVEGFYDYTDGNPYAFAFWFIRNLMIFVVLSPIAYILSSKNWIINLVFILGCCVADTTFWGFSFFVIGGMIARFFSKNISNLPLLPVLLSGAVWIGISALRPWQEYPSLYSTFLIVESLAALICLMPLAKYFRTGFISRHVVPATFFIYAFHQLFCTVTRNFYIDIFGLNTSSRIFLSYLFTFLTLSGISFMTWSVLSKISPSLLNILCGNRSAFMKRKPQFAR